MNRPAMLIIGIIIFIIILYLSRNKLRTMLTQEKLSDDFFLYELVRTRQPYPNIPNEQETNNLRLLTNNVLQPSRNLINSKMVPTSGYRSELVNRAVGGAKKSQHRFGLACDFVTPDMDLDEAFNMIAKSNIPYDQIILETGSRGERWIHISYNPKGGRRQAMHATFNHSKGKMDYTLVNIA